MRPFSVDDSNATGERTHRQAPPNPLKRPRREDRASSIAAPQLADPHAAAAQIKQIAGDLGFQLVGIAPAVPSKRKDYFRDWLAAGRHGEMNYLADRFDERTDPTVALPGAKAVICVAISYFAPDAHTANTAIVADTNTTPGRIARYARGDDYHDVLKPRLYDLADYIRKTWPGAETRCGVDSAPLMEKELAALAGIGWQGKNTLILNASTGSWLLLGEVITTLDLPIDTPAIDRCGSCTRCIDACPTNAITAPYQLDATRCISYLTIEQRTGEIDAALAPKMGDWLFGCDVCQEVCPFNRAPLETLDPALRSRFENGTIDAASAIAWSPEDFSATFRRSAVRRIKLPVLQRNARVVIDNRA